METVITICYGQIEEWTDRKEAEQYFLEAMAGTEGSEHERYSNIYCDLLAGKRICRDFDIERSTYETN